MNGTSATFEWQPSGPFVNYKSSSFRCLKDLNRTRQNCEHMFSTLVKFNPLRIFAS